MTTTAPGVESDSPEVKLLASIAKHWPPLSAGIPAFTQAQAVALLDQIRVLQLSLTASGDLRVGSFTLRASPDPEFILMRHESGEGGSFKTANLEQALFKFFGEQF